MAIAGNIYKHKKTKKSAVVSGLVAALVMGIVSVFSNYFVVYPVYYKAGMAEEAILQMYQAIAPSMKSVLQCLICFNLPFTIVKGLIAVVICMLIYKPLSPVLKGRLSLENCYNMIQRNGFLCDTQKALSFILDRRRRHESVI